MLPAWKLLDQPLHSLLLHGLRCRSSLETARLMASALGGGLDSAEAGVAGVMAAMPPQYVEFKEQVCAEKLCCNCAEIVRLRQPFLAALQLLP